MMEAAIVSFVCLIQARGYGAADLSLPFNLRATTEDGRFFASAGVPTLSTR